MKHMISKDLLFDLYDKCLGSLDAPFRAMGEEVSGSPRWAVSFWMENIGAPGALVRLGFHSDIKQDELAQEDHRIALQCTRRRKKSAGRQGCLRALPWRTGKSLL